MAEWFRRFCTAHLFCYRRDDLIEFLTEPSQDRLHARMPDEKIQPQEIVFSNNNAAKLVSASRDKPMANLIESLGISPPKNLILVIGGADELDQKLTSRLTQLFSRGIARAAADAEALIIDGGTQEGVMHCRSRTQE